MKYAIFDCEADGLLEDCTKFHCLCAVVYENGVCKERIALTDPSDMREFLLREDQILIGHNIVRYDVELIYKMLGITISGRLIDTLPLSWYLFPKNNAHGLEYWGNQFQIAKPEIKDWKDLPVEQYIYRCSEDVKINERLFLYQLEYLKRLYDSNTFQIDRIMGYLTFKMKCAREQEEVKWKVDVDKARANLELVRSEWNIKHLAIQSIMPCVVIEDSKEMPRVMLKKDGTPSAASDKWREFLRIQGKPDYYNGSVKYIKEIQPGNPTSQHQLKKWLVTLGWKPITFQMVKNKAGYINKVDQIANEDKSGEVCDSVKLLFSANPGLEHLNDFFILNHRIGILEGFLDRENLDSDNKLSAQIKGLTNTLRFKHSKPLTNIPTAPKKHWRLIRECLVAGDGELLCGSDMSGLEDTTKQHYMWSYDSRYVEEMRTPDWDAHLDVAVLAGLMTEDEAREHKLYDKTKGAEGKSHKVTRGIAKRVNFAAVYGAFPPKLALTANISINEAKTLFDTYWRRNKAVKQVSEDCIMKRIGSDSWLWNPVSQFWYSLRAEKDRFSTLNQGTGVYCFDTWVKYVRRSGIKLCGQFHDEIIFPLQEGTEEEITERLRWAIDNTNEELKLNVPLNISIDFGKNYADVH